VIAKLNRDLSIFTIASILFSYLIWELTKSKNEIYLSLFVFMILSIMHYRFFYINTQNLQHTIIIALLIRVTFLFQEPLFSDDVYRYLWDAMLLLNSENPIQYAPDNQLFIGYSKQYEYFELINNRNLASSYNLFVQSYMVVVNLISNSIIFLKFSYLIVETASIYFFLRYNLFKKEFVIFLIMHPLIWIEIYQSAHFDILYLYFSLFAIAFFKEQKYYLSSFFNIISGQIRYISSIVFLFQKRTRISSIISILLFLSVTLWMSQFSDNGVLVYSKDWSFNNPLYELMHFLLLPFYHEINSFLPFGIFLKLTLFICLGFIFLKKLLDCKDRIVEFFTFFSIFLILSSSVVYPWYCILIVPLSFLLRNNALVTFSYSIFFSYFILIRYFQEFVWKESIEQYFLVYLVPILVYLYEKPELRNKLKYFLKG
jgi:alpha-1,6-mannosyltransferase